MTTAPNARFTAAEVLAIREDFEVWKAAGGRQATYAYRMADKYKVGVETIRKMLRGETFRHVGGAKSPVDVAEEAAEAALLEASRRRLEAALGQNPRSAEPSRSAASPVDEALTKPSSALDLLVAEMAKSPAAAVAEIATGRNPFEGGDELGGP